ncbi:MAG: methyltransferase [Spongiibacteraceae bacterium]
MKQNLNILFEQLSTALLQTQNYWRPTAFHEVKLPWMEQHPALLQRLLNLSPQQINKLATNTTALIDFFANDLPIASELAQLCAIPALQHQPTAKVSPRFYAGIPGRKWQQVEAFTACVSATDLSVLEWCAGKSHLGFYMQHCNNTPVTALEWDPGLVQQANERADRGHIALHSHTVDVLSDAANHFIKPEQQVVALHACGELHERLLKLCVENHVQQLHIAPCCYHKRQHNLYTPLSQQGRNLDLKLDKTAMHTAVMETATAGATIQRQRSRLQIMRLGFDCLQKQLRGSDEFLALPSLPAKWARASFSDFCRYSADMKGIDLPTTVDWSHYLKLGEQRFWQVAALDLIRFLFRRPLEVWLVLDRALLLQEYGYSVQVGTFCSATITPRNLLVQAYSS